MSVISVSEVKARLNKTLTVDDVELQDMLDAAEAEYAALVSPLVGKTLRYDGGRSRLILPVNATAVTAVTYADGTVVDVTDLDFDADSGILHWSSGTAGVFAVGSRNVLVTFTVDLPANHREAILADVAGYFAATQRGNSPGALPVGYDAVYQQQEVTGSGPVNLFPRIRALAANYPAIA